MNCLIIQSAGVHDGMFDTWTANHYLRECHALAFAFQELGITPTIWGLRHANFYNLPKFDSFDIIFTLENYEMSWLPPTAWFGNALKVAWIIDLHVEPIDRYLAYQSYDIILHSTKSLIPKAMGFIPNAKHLWFPNCVDKRYFDLLYSTEKTIPVLFVGKKRPMIEDLVKDVGLEYHFATGLDMIKLISSAKIHFNSNIGVDINYRTFETIGLGTCLVTNNSKELRELNFVDGVNCITYNCYEDAVYKIKWLLDTGAWYEIGRAGNNLSKKHTYTERIRSILLPEVKQHVI